MAAASDVNDLTAFINSLVSDHGDLNARWTEVTVDATAKDPRVTIRAQYLSFRDSRPTVGEFIDMLTYKIVPFCLHRNHIRRVQKIWNAAPAHRIQREATQLYQQAIDLFKKAMRASNRNGEFGELAAY